MLLTLFSMSSIHNNKCQPKKENNRKIENNSKQYTHRKNKKNVSKKKNVNKKKKCGNMYNPFQVIKAHHFGKMPTEKEQFIML